MTSMILYIGPGLGIGTIIIVLIVLLIVVVSLLIIVWTPIKKFFNRVFKKAENKK